MLRFAFRNRFSSNVAIASVGMMHTQMAAQSSTGGRGGQTPRRDQNRGGIAGAARANKPSPEFEIYDVHDNPADGKLIRVTYRDRQVTINVSPQLGPRKSDPNDPTPQFDFGRRSGVRFRATEVANFLAVMEGKVGKAEFVTKGHDLVFTPQEDNAGYTLSGSVTRPNTDPVSWNLQLNKLHVTMFYRFLDSSLNESFGYDVLKNPEFAEKYSKRVY